MSLIAKNTNNICHDDEFSNSTFLPSEIYCCSSGHINTSSKSSIDLVLRHKHYLKSTTHTIKYKMSTPVIQTHSKNFSSSNIKPVTLLGLKTKLGSNESPDENTKKPTSHSLNTIGENNYSLSDVSSLDLNESDSEAEIGEEIYDLN